MSKAINNQSALQSIIANEAITLVHANSFVATLDLGLPDFEDRDAAIGMAYRLAAPRGQGEFSVLVVNLTAAEINSDKLDDMLAAAFPGTKAATNPGRHGNYYLSKCRTGKMAAAAGLLPGMAEKLRANKGTRAGAAAAPAIESFTIEQLKAMLETKEAAAAAEAAKIEAINKAEADRQNHRKARRAKRNSE
jgi:hypothetical protein